MKMIITAAAAALSIGAMASPALANDERPTTKVWHNDLNLATKAGRKALDRRIDQAARKICGLNTVSIRSRSGSSSERACYRTAKASVESQVAALTAQHQGRS